MSDLRWDEARGFFDPARMGALPEVHVPGADAEDWQAVLDLVAECGWECQYTEGASQLPVPAAAMILSLPAGAASPQLRVWPAAGIEVIFRFVSAEAIDFDVDVRELQGQERLDRFCEFLTAVGRRLGKPVLMDAEGSDGAHPVLGFTLGHDRVVTLTKP